MKEASFKLPDLVAAWGKRLRKEGIKHAPRMWTTNTLPHVAATTTTTTAKQKQQNKYKNALAIKFA